MYDTYTSPLASRNASDAMLRLWSPRHKFNTWRRIWLAVAEAQHELTCAPKTCSPTVREGSEVVGGPKPSLTVGLHAGSEQHPQHAPLVTKDQLEELRAVVNKPGGITDAEIKLAEKYERDLRHDVMAHVHALGDSCPKAKGIIHLGMTSQDVVCNADIAVIRDSINLIQGKVYRVLFSLSDFATKWRNLPTLGFTHYQPAQPVTVGRRAATWAYDTYHVGWRFDDTLYHLWYKGIKGATGTQAATIALVGDDEDDLVRLDEGVSSGFSDSLRSSRLAFNDVANDHVHDLATQTYPRVIDTFILADLASTAAVLHKIATDIRLLCNRKEIDEPFESKQIGSSAMPYKRNPMRCERICGLTRFVMNLVGNAYDTAATQWLERTLDDSSNRRLSLPEAFLALDGALDLMHNVASGLIVHEAMVRKNLMAELPFMATENILMACVKTYVGTPPGTDLGTPTLRVGSIPEESPAEHGNHPTRSVGVPSGGDRQEYHELIRQHAQAAGLRVKQEGLDNDLLDRLKADKHFWSTKRGGPLREELDWDNLLDPMKYIGRSVEQTERFIKEVVEPLREQYKDELAKLEESSPKV